MKLSRVINGDHRDLEIRDAAQIWLKKIDVLGKRTKDDEDVALLHIEKLMHSLCKRYGYSIQWINVTYMHERGEEPQYTLSLKTVSDHKWVGTVYGLSLYETMAKGLLMLYTFVKKGERNEG